MKTHYDVIIIGGGVVGSAILRELSKYEINVVLIEKEADVAEGTSKANSGVLHAGFNVRPGSLKARLNVEGLKTFPALADELGIPWKRCEKLVVASREEEFAYLDGLLIQGMANGCSGLSIIGREDIRSLEPKVRGERALYSQSTGIVSPFLLNIALAENALLNGAHISLSSRVTGISKDGNRFIVSTDSGMTLTSDFLVNSAGLFAGEIARMAGSSVPKIYPCRGEYFIVDRKAGRDDGGILSMAVYPVPPADGHGLGVHLTPTLNGNILIGPSAEYVDRPDNLENTALTMALLKQEARVLLPELADFDLIKSYSGNRAKLFSPNDGLTFADFFIEESEDVACMINLAGIESPGLTASPAIGVMVREMIGEKLKLKRKKNFETRWKGPLRLDHLSLRKREEMILENSDFGEIVCRCEGITRGEILSALDNPLGVKTLNGIKKRTYSMMGRCQSGFCLPRILSILKEEGIKSGDIVKDGPPGFVVLGERG